MSLSVTAAARNAVRRVIPLDKRHWLRRHLGGGVANRRGRWDDEHDGRPDRWPDDLIVAPPDYIGIGMHRSGSTWWWRMINLHPDVFRAPRVAKELRVLFRFYDRDPTDAEVADYHRWFPRPAGKRAGEWTPRYMAFPWMGAVLQRCAPHAKILVILRDPVERYRSGLALQQPHIDSAAALRQSALGYYSRQLELIEAHVEPSNLLVLQYERCRDDPETQLARTYEFIGLDRHEVGAEVMRQNLARPLDKPPLSPERRRVLIDAYAPEVDALFSRYPDFDPSLWPNFD